MISYRIFPFKRTGAFIKTAVLGGSALIRGVRLFEWGAFINLGLLTKRMIPMKCC